MRLLPLLLLLASCAPVGVASDAHVPGYYETDVVRFQMHLLADDWQTRTEADRADLCRRYWQEGDMLYAFYYDVKIVKLERSAFDKFFSGECGDNPGVVG